MPPSISVLLPVSMFVSLFVSLSMSCLCPNSCVQIPVRVPVPVYVPFLSLQCSDIVQCTLHTRHRVECTLFTLRTLHPGPFFPSL